MIGSLYRCGPLAVELHVSDSALKDKVAETLNLYTVEWPIAGTPIRIEVSESQEPASMLGGGYLTCGRMNVDATPLGLAATCRSGASCHSDGSRKNWVIEVPRVTTTGETVPEDIEDLVGLILTTGLRDLRWVTLHSGCVTTDSTCALLCASSGGGKTTLTAALIRRGWKTLGDDKLLLGLDETGDPVLLSLINNFNLHPNTRRWFPEVGDLSVLPRYSAWTEKRKVRVEDIWPESMLEKAWPTHLIEIHRRNGKSGLSIEGLDTDQLLSVLLRQTVIPHEPNVAREILSALTATAPRLCGVKLVIGESAYRDDSCLAALEDALL